MLLEELDGDDLIVRIQATPERSADGAKLADEIIAVLASVTGEHARVNGDHDSHRDPDSRGDRDSRGRDGDSRAPTDPRPATDTSSIPESDPGTERYRTQRLSR